ncbi:hypothetical protein [Rhodopseudomonas sp. BR0G17]|nr:hypothetical protein [Rhodopseudomonas sp. BR0G17]
MSDRAETHSWIVRVARRFPKLTILSALQAKLDTGAIPNLPLVEIMV